MTAFALQITDHVSHELRPVLHIMHNMDMRFRTTHYACISINVNDETVLFSG